MILLSDNHWRSDGVIMAGIELRKDYSAADLGALARKVRDAKQARRLMMVTCPQLEGHL